MAAITMLTPNRQNYQLLETIAIVDQAAAGPTSVTKGIYVPPWARHATFVINDLTMGGTSPDFTFVIEGVDVALTQPPDSDDLFMFGGWDGITPKTAAAGTVTVIDIGPEYAADDTGSATASDRYGIQTALVPVLAYTYSTTGGGAALEDYDATISVYWMS